MAEKKSSKSKSAAKPYPETAYQPAGKVAEALATYGVLATPKPKTAARTIAGLKADSEVWAFVDANNLLPHLQTAIRLARDTFIDIRKMWLSYEPDPELPKFNSIVIWVKARGTVENLFEQEKKYIRAFNESIPPDFRYQIDLLLGVA
ncbi:hypothetical protein L0337_23350 [candidate division KSB1 bacterium]|nr:hypothetical protein [candidate division KSB1 bacterium]